MDCPHGVHKGAQPFPRKQLPRCPLCRLVQRQSQVTVTALPKPTKSTPPDPELTAAAIARRLGYGAQLRIIDREDHA